MAQQLPYLSSYKNVEQLFSRIQSAKQPDAFTHRFLLETIGLKSTADRALIPLLKNMGFLDGSNRPTTAYAELKNPGSSRRAIAEGIRRAYAPVFTANEKANELQGDQLRGLIGQIAGTDAGLTSKITGTFNALAKLADFSSQRAATLEENKDELEKGNRNFDNRAQAGLRTDFHYNIQIHLPANATEETYRNIFNALREVFR